MQLGQVNVRLGQINQGGYSWNWAPGAFNPYGAPIRQAAPNVYGGRPAAYSEPIAAGPSCYTCTNPSTGDTQFGVPQATADTLKGQGYKCRKDECAARGYAPVAAREAYQGSAALLNPLYSSGQVAQGLTQVTTPMDFTSVMSGRAPSEKKLGAGQVGGIPTWVLVTTGMLAAAGIALLAVR